MKNLKYLDKKLLIATIILFAFGLVMIYSASNVTAYVLYNASPSRYFLYQSFFLGLGTLATFFAINFISTNLYYSISKLCMLIIIIVIFSTVVYGTAINGATNWIGYKGFGIQPSELAKIIIIPYLAIYYDRNKKDNNDEIKMLAPLLPVALIVGLVLFGKDIGTAGIIVLISATIFFLSPISKRIKKKYAIICALAVLFLSIFLLFFGSKVLSENKINRFNTYNPCERYINEGNQLCNGYIAMNNGGITGKSLGNSTQKYLYLAEPHTDFIYAILVEELGVIGAGILMIFYIFVILRIVRSGKRAKRISRQVICYGVAFYIFIHIFINLGGVTGLIPLTGVPLAFISYGGSYCLSLIVALAMVQTINIETNKRLKINKG